MELKTASQKTMILGSACVLALILAFPLFDSTHAHAITKTLISPGYSVEGIFPTVLSLREENRALSFLSRKVAIVCKRYIQSNDAKFCANAQLDHLCNVRTSLKKGVTDVGGFNLFQYFMESHEPVESFENLEWVSTRLGKAPGLGRNVQYVPSAPDLFSQDWNSSRSRVNLNLRVLSGHSPLELIRQVRFSYQTTTYSTVNGNATIEDIGSLLDKTPRGGRRSKRFIEGYIALGLAVDVKVELDNFKKAVVGGFDLIHNILSNQQDAIIAVNGKVSVLAENQRMISGALDDFADMFHRNDEKLLFAFNELRSASAASDFNLAVALNCEINSRDVATLEILGERAVQERLRMEEVFQSMPPKELIYQFQAQRAFSTRAHELKIAYEISSDYLGVIPDLFEKAVLDITFERAVLILSGVSIFGERVNLKELIFPSVLQRGIVIKTKPVPYVTSPGGVNCATGDYNPCAELNSVMLCYHWESCYQSSCMQSVFTKSSRKGCEVETVPYPLPCYVSKIGLDLLSVSGICSVDVLTINSSRSYGFHGDYLIDHSKVGVRVLGHVYGTSVNVDFEAPLIMAALSFSSSPLDLFNLDIYDTPTIELESRPLNLTLGNFSHWDNDFKVAIANSEAGLQHLQETVDKINTTTFGLDLSGISLPKLSVLGAAGLSLSTIAFILSLVNTGFLLWILCKNKNQLTRYIRLDPSEEDSF